MTGILEAFEAYVKKHGYGEQYAEDIFPVFAAGFVEGQKTVRRGLKKQENDETYTRRTGVYLQRGYRGNPVNEN